MEPTEIRRRGRKRKRKDGDNVPVDEQQLKKPAVETRSKALVGRYVKKEFDSVVFLGKIVSYDTGLYRVEYEDGDSEDLGSSQVRKYLMADDYLDDHLIERRRKLDELVSSKDVNNVKDLVRPEHLLCATNVPEATSADQLCNGFVGDNRVNGDEEADADSSSDSCECDGDRDMMISEVELPTAPPPEFPPSSGTIGIPGEYVPHLLSVYGFLRTFSIRLFLNPFGLDEFVGSLKCSIPNTLLDFIHVALLRALRRHLEIQSSDDIELASKCLRCMDWNLLDLLTWPAYLVEYLIVMGHTSRLECKGFYTNALKTDYYAISEGTKLICLQILCDDILDFEELKAEIDMREELEIGADLDAAAATSPQGGFESTRSRYSKTCAGKEQNYGTSISWCSSSLNFGGAESSTDVVDQDGNGDECRLCGMDGTLLCCDGCPSAYHPRCIGLNKVSIPEGAWYCPECNVNKIGPTIIKGSSLRGAETFGVDIYGNAFLGTCNYLLVLTVLSESDSCLRYYNPDEILPVLRALQSSAEHITTYSDICEAISQYWEIPKALFISETVQMGMTLKAKGSTDFHSSSITTLDKEGQNAPGAVEVDKASSCVTQSGSLTLVETCFDNNSTEPDFTENTNHTNFHSYHVNQQNVDISSGQATFQMNTRLVEQVKVEAATSSGSVSQQVYPFRSMQQNLSEKSGLTENATAEYSIGILWGNECCMSAPESVPSQWKSNGVGSIRRNQAADFLYMGSSFRSHGYLNNYVHGDFAASAAGNLAVLSSEERKLSESYILDNHRKVMSANASLQFKAFSSAASHFFWPHLDKKLVEGPRERCGWCLYCKAPVASRKGCLLNAAISNAIKGAMKTLPRLRPVKNGDGNLIGITTYIMLLEESLSGLTIGPFLNALYRKEWRKQVEQATTIRRIKFLLLELEKNIRIIAFSADWVKLVDIWSVESSITQNATCTAGATLKRAAGGRRGRKPSVVVEAADDGVETKAFFWWSGGLLSRFVFQKGTLPCPLIKRAARLGGSRSIPGIYYSEGSEAPLRSRQLVWRAAVEMSRTSSQLALQVRLLDHYVRWCDLIRPEDGKGLEAEASAFRNASICGKKCLENTTKYGVDFVNRKPLPSRVMRSVTEVEQREDGKEIYWFCETRIPPYLIKEYEDVGKGVVPSYLPGSNHILSNLQRRPCKAHRKDIFSYLVRKRDYMDEICCSSCRLVLILGDAVKCSACQGYCHKHCTVSSTLHVNGEVEFLMFCNQCYHTEPLVQKETTNESPTSPLLLQGQDFQNVLQVTGVGKPEGPNLSLPSHQVLHPGTEATSDSSSALKSRRKLSWGLIWKKKNCNDAGIDFRLKNILLKGNPDNCRSGPECHLCHKPYNYDLMYIRCEACQNWYHADAVELEESKIFDLVGFKCCRCRRIKSPACPYKDPDNKKQIDSNKQRTKAPKQSKVPLKPGSGAIAVQVKVEESVPSLDKEGALLKSNPPFFTPSTVKQFTEGKSEGRLELNDASASNAPQKLPVRRQTNSDCNDYYVLGNVASHLESSTPIQGNVSNHAEQSEWDASANGFEERLMFDYDCLNYEDMEFEPQTYFSFTELLSPDDGGQHDGANQSGNTTENWENASAIKQEVISGTNQDQQGLEVINISSAVNGVPCKVCSLSEPQADISCEICGLWFHRLCSPWTEEESHTNGSWKCAGCKEWR